MRPFTGCLRDAIDLAQLCDPTVRCRDHADDFEIVFMDRNRKIMSKREFRHKNLLLNQMSAEDISLLEPDFDFEHIEQDRCLTRSDEPVEHLYFLDSGVASVVSNRDDGVRVELAVIGREGVTGIAGLMGAALAPQDTMIQVDHAYAHRIGTAAMLAAMDASPSLRQLMLRYVQTVIVQICDNAATNVSARLDARLARWLLMCHDRVEGDEIGLTHRYMAMMIGAPRTAVTSLLHRLEGARMIRALRGRVVVADRAGLEAMAGASYGTPEREYRRLIGAFGKSMQSSSASLK
jgi:CRP-like cAMP-binding protein